MRLLLTFNHRRPCGTTEGRMSYKPTIIDRSDPYTSGVLGDLTDRQYAALAEVARLSKGYNFEVWRYHGGPNSRATHVAIFRDGNKSNEVGLVGLDCVLCYEKDPVTHRVVRRVCHRVYRK